MKTILLVEDNLDIHELMSFFLTEEGYIVISAFNGKEALDHIGTNDTIDIIITDYLMPIMDGGAMIGILKNTHNKTPIIVCSGSHGVAQDERLRGCLFHPKPFDFPILNRTIQELLT
jgi:CheY-like chemotaxis protein